MQAKEKPAKHCYVFPGVEITYVPSRAFFFVFSCTEPEQKVSQPSFDEATVGHSKSCGHSTEPPTGHAKLQSPHQIFQYGHVAVLRVILMAACLDQTQQVPAHKQTC
eukprot:2566042-Rhodomonas_salina.1